MTDHIGCGILTLQEEETLRKRRVVFVHSSSISRGRHTLQGISILLQVETMNLALLLRL
jgi:hypothetical protein